MMYEAYQAQTDLLWPLRTFTKAALPMLKDGTYGWNRWMPNRKLAAAWEVFGLSEVTHKRRPFAIDQVAVTGVDEPVAITEVATHVASFATLLHFRKELKSTGEPLPKVLIVAPMSGHFATLLRETVRTMLADHDVYITDWHNARDVLVSAGGFGLDEYTEHIIDFLTVMGPGSHLMAICQPCVSALAATAVMSEDHHPATPSSLTLMAGPIDCRISPTAVNQLAITKPIEWFESHLIGRVPLRYPGAGRRVYPGFVQLTAFMSMNKDRHVNSFKELYQLLHAQEVDGLVKAEATRTFYEEYFAMADLPAEFYLETVKAVFQDYSLPKGELMYRDRLVKPSAIRRTALLTVEGERDDICAVGQTLAAHDLCTGLREYLKTHYVQAGVGHYGVFSGRRWNQNIYPVVRESIHTAQASL
ncbi:MAG: polyhydroxyalkanoate depolymerase [Pseudomonadota bacterium]|nr:polyhydroxyalkanoate depolymerase [Pseudomonadota bacterium]